MKPVISQILLLTMGHKVGIQVKKPVSQCKRKCQLNNSTGGKTAVNGGNGENTGLPLSF